MKRKLKAILFGIIAAEILINALSFAAVKSKKEAVYLYELLTGHAFVILMLAFVYCVHLCIKYSNKE